MSTFDLTRVPDDDLMRDLMRVAARDRTTTAEVLAHIAEVDVRQLYRSRGFPSMREYCIHELRFSEDAAAKRIHAARKAREFPALFSAVAEGRLHLAAIGLLGSYLAPSTVDELIEMATHQTKAEIELLLARRFPKSDVFTWVGSASSSREEPGDSTSNRACQHAPGHVGMTSHEQSAPRMRVEPLSPARFALQASIGEGVYRKLEQARALLGHALPSGDLEGVLERALDALIEKLEKRKYGSADRSRGRAATPSSSRRIPAEVRRAVRARDGSQCTFVAPEGRRCAARTRLEFDHVIPFARGGEATVENLRLRCRAHNQLAAEQAFGRELVRAKREGARRAAAAQARDAAAEQDPERSVIPWLRRLGFRPDEARRAAARCAHLSDAPMAERVRAALAGSVG
jgi:hypothetical protein